MQYIHLTHLISVAVSYPYRLPQPVRLIKLLTCFPIYWEKQQRIAVLTAMLTQALDLKYCSFHLMYLSKEPINFWTVQNDLLIPEQILSEFWSKLKAIRIINGFRAFLEWKWLILYDKLCRHFPKRVFFVKQHIDF